MKILVDAEPRVKQIKLTVSEQKQTLTLALDIFRNLKLFSCSEKRSTKLTCTALL